MKLQQQVERSIQSRKLFRRGERILVAVSGGVDSMVLLALLQALAARYGWQLAVAHFNHQLRGRASDADERLVARTAQALALPFHSGRGEVRALAKGQGISIEMAARELRHKFLAGTARGRKCSAIATAHHADDQVELFFLRLLRGAGAEGLAGMKWSSPAPMDGKVRMVRPLLAVSKEELVAFARREKILFREDASNISPDMLRNRLRHDLLPRVRQDYQPALSRVVLRLMELVGADAEVVEELAASWLAKFPRGGGWSRLAIGVQRRVLQRQLQQLKVTPDFELVEWLRLQPGKRVSVEPDRFVLRKPNGQVLEVATVSQAFVAAERKLNLAVTRSVSFGELELTWKVAVRRRGERPKPVANREFFDADKVGGSVVMRHWRPGDRFQPIGMKAAVKLQDWFTNQKIPAARRRRLTLATTAQGEIFWVEGLRIGERFKITTNTRKTLVWRWLVRNPPEVLHCGAIDPMLGFAR